MSSRMESTVKQTTKVAVPGGFRVKRRSVRRSTQTHVRGFEESVKAIEQACKEQGPFDGILGFSQGAAMTAMILVLQSLKRIECSFKFRCPSETDNIIPKAQATEILPFFVSPSVLYHPGGHFLPTDFYATDYASRAWANNHNAELASAGQNTPYVSPAEPICWTVWLLLWTAMTSLQKSLEKNTTGAPPR
ncbi:hypothetical protein MRX96_049686 [Rhipicephalus microplus]